MKSIIWQYINEETEKASTLYKSKQILEIADLMKKYECVYFVAHGSSYNACRTTADFFSRKTNMRAYVLKPHELRCNCSSLLLEDSKKTIVVGISQTGTSRGVLEALSHAKKYGFLTVALTAQENSPIVQQNDAWLDLCCGEEDSNAKTKGFTCTLIALLLLSISTGYLKNVYDLKEYQRLLKIVDFQIQSLDKTIGECRKWCEQNNYGKEMKQLFIIGYGMNYGTALELALKMLETTCIPTVIEDIEEFSHGTHRAVAEDSHMIILCTDQDGQEAAEKSYEYFVKICKSCVMLNASGNYKKGDNFINLPYAKEVESILAMTAAIQVLSVFTPENQGNDPNRNAHDDYTQVLETRV